MLFAYTLAIHIVLHKAGITKDFIVYGDERLKYSDMCVQHANVAADWYRRYAKHRLSFATVGVKASCEKLAAYPV